MQRRGTVGRTIRIVLACLAIWAPLAGQEGELPHVPELGRCLDLDVGRWSPEIDLRADTLYIAPPPRVRLDSVPGDGGSGWRLSPAPGALPSVHGIRRWRVGEADSLELLFSTGFSGLVITMGEAEDGTRRGTARSFWDFGRTRQAAPVVARAIPCDAPLAMEDRLVYRFPRGVETATGDSVRLGDPWPGPAEGERRGYALDVSLAPPLNDVEDVRVWGDPDQGIRRIRLRLPGGVGFREALRRVEPLLGPPTWDSEHTNDGVTSLMAGWSGRLVSISLMSWRRDGEDGPVSLAWSADSD